MTSVNMLVCVSVSGAKIFHELTKILNMLTSVNIEHFGMFVPIALLILVYL
jgi:hypothetical protein